MDLLDAVELLVKNPLLETSLLDGLSLDSHLVESYKKSHTHNIRAILSNNKCCCDMSHVVPFADMSHVTPFSQ